MNVTFFIGNGFDLALGLKTRYIDFYNSYEKKLYANIGDPFAREYAKKMNRNKDLLSNIINDPNRNINWSNFEEELCLKYINDIKTKEQERQFIQDYYKFKNELSDYLKEQSNIILLDKSNSINSNIYNVTIKSLCKFHEYLSNTNRERLRKYFSEKLNISMA